MNSPRFLHDGRSYPLLTWTSTMGCWSWSLPAGKDHSCPMESRAPNSICNSCYAQQNRYRFPSVRNAQLARLSFLRTSPAACESLLTTFLLHHTPTYFRVHDSGDFHSIDTIYMWASIVSACPSTRFWFPTRAWVFPHWLTALRSLAAIPNAIVRPSALHFDDPPPSIPGLSAGSSSSRESTASTWDCPKALNHSTCDAEGCRTCWSSIIPVNYRPHGRPLPGRPVPLTHRGSMIA